MATKQVKPTDITKSGPQSFRDLQQQNDLSGAVDPAIYSALMNMAPVISQHDIRYNSPRPFATPLLNTEKGEYYGNSYFDPDYLTDEDLYKMQGNPNELRAENQPWFSKLVNGIGKAGVLAGTTAAELGGLIYGVGQGIFAKNGKSFLQDLWDNPVTNALNNISQASEELMPNYYTQDEIENPFGNIFTANFLGDKILKNLGFMVGAFYGGIPASKLIGAVGVRAAKAARAASLAERAGMAERTSQLVTQYGDDIAGLNRALKVEHLTDVEKAKRIQDGLDKVRNVAKTTRATAQVVGSLGSAINEGAIEAIQNSKDWADAQRQQENDEYMQKLAAIEEQYGGTEVEVDMKMAAAEEHQQKLAEIEKGRARVGNADLLLNIPILTATNLFELGKLYTRGFDSTRRQMGSWFTGNKLSGELAKGTLKSDRTWKKGLVSSLMKSNAEGMEEYLQRSASDGAGNAVMESINRFFNAGEGEGPTNRVEDYIAGFGKAIADNFSNPQAWEEYMIGAVSSMVGMPVFGSQTKNAYGFMKDNGVFGFAGGLYGNYQDYMDAKKHEEDVAKYLNKRVKDPKFKELYKHLKSSEDFEALMEDAIANGDKEEYKNIKFEKLFNDINAAASAGHLAEFKALVNYNDDYSDDELLDILKTTNRVVSAEEQKQRDEDRAEWLQRQLTDRKGLDNEIRELGDQMNDIALRIQEGNLTEQEEEELDNQYDDILVRRENLKELRDKISADSHSDEYSEDELKEFKEELDAINNRLGGEYKDKIEGPFMTSGGEMILTEEGKQKAISILERNKKSLNQAIDDYLKIRNDIDIETDGRLKDDDISLLTMMKAKILNYDRRSAEMAVDLIENLGDIKQVEERSKQKIEQEKQEAQSAYDTAVSRLQKVRQDKKSKKKVKKAEEAVKTAKDKLDKVEKASRINNNVLGLLDLLTEQKETTTSERVAFSRGLGEDRLERLESALRVGETRDINSDEAQAILTNPLNLGALMKIIDTNIKDENVKNRLLKEAASLYTIGHEKAAYNKELRRLIGDPSLINELGKQAGDRLKEKDIENKSDELALNIKKAKDMTELHNLIKNASAIDPRIVQSALQKAKQASDDDGKKFIEEYEKASNFYREFIKRSNKQPENIRAAIAGTAASAWEYALTGVGVYDRFVESLQGAADDLEATGTPDNVQVSKTIKTILKDLDAAKKSNTTKSSKEVKKGTSSTKKEEQPEGEKSEQEKRVSSFFAQAGKAEEKKPSEPDTYKTLTDAISKELKGNSRITSVDGLSEALRQRIAAFNKTQEDEDKITNTTVKSLVQQFADAGIERDGNVGEDKGEEFDTADGAVNARSAQMSENVAQNFVSDYVSQYEFGPTTPFDYRVPYSDDTKKNASQIAAIQKLLKDYKAYDFIDRNLLGYIYQDNPEVPIHFLKTTIDDINPKTPDDKPITLLAIKWDNKAKRAVRKGAFGGKTTADLSSVVHPVKIGDEEYQIVGVLSIKGKVTDATSAAFSSLITQINQDLKDELTTAKENGQEFVTWNHTSTISQINTGRLEKRNDDYDHQGKVSLYDFVATAQGSDERRGSIEWENGVSFKFGVVVNGQIGEDLEGNYVAPSDELMRSNNGAIMLFVPKADGKMYPIRCTRRTVGEWLEKKANATETGRDVLNKVLDESVRKAEKNEYISNIVEYLKTLFDEESDFAAKMDAKTQLSKYFNFRGSSPIRVDVVNDRISLFFGTTMEEVYGDSVEEKINRFFDLLADNNIQFSLPNPGSEEGKRISGRQVILSGVFEVGLRGFYNFNANFTVTPITPQGDPIEAQSEGNPEEYGNAPNISPNGITYNINGEDKTYLIEKEGDYYTLKYADGSEVTDNNEKNIVIAAYMASRGEDGSAISASSKLVNDIWPDDNPKVNDFRRQAMSAYNEVYIITAEDGDWVYDRRVANNKETLYKLDSELDRKYNYVNKDDEDKKKGLTAVFTSKVREFNSNNMRKILELREAVEKEKKASNTTAPVVQNNTAPETSEAPVPVGGDEATGVLQGLSWDSIDDSTELHPIVSILKQENKKAWFSKLQALEKGGIPLNADVIKDAVDNNWKWKDLENKLKCSL